MNEGTLVNGCIMAVFLVGGLGERGEEGPPDPVVALA